MNWNIDPQRKKRLSLVASGITDAILGSVILLSGFGFFPIDTADLGFPLWVVLLIGGIMFTVGIWMTVHNYSRLDE